jgi:hypothetical protein
LGVGFGVGFLVIEQTRKNNKYATSLAVMLSTRNKVHPMLTYLVAFLLIIPMGPFACLGIGHSQYIG